ANTGEDNFFAGNAEMAQVFELAARDNVEAAAQLQQILEDGEISVGLDGKAEHVRKRTKPVVQLAKRGFDRGPAVDVSWRREGFGSAGQSDTFAEHLLAGSAPRFAPRKIRGEFRGVDEPQRSCGCYRLPAHRTLSTTRVRSSESGALWANQSISRRMRSEISVALSA